MVSRHIHTLDKILISEQSLEGDMYEYDTVELVPASHVSDENIDFTVIPGVNQAFQSNFQKYHRNLDPIENQ